MPFFLRLAVGCGSSRASPFGLESHCAWPKQCLQISVASDRALCRVLRQIWPVFAMVRTRLGAPRAGHSCGLERLATCACMCPLMLACVRSCMCTPVLALCALCAVLVCMCACARLPCRRPLPCQALVIGDKPSPTAPLRSVALRPSSTPSRPTSTWTTCSRSTSFGRSGRIVDNCTLKLVCGKKLPIGRMCFVSLRLRSAVGPLGGRSLGLRPPCRRVGRPRPGLWAPLFLRSWPPGPGLLAPRGPVGPGFVSLL